MTRKKGHGEKASRKMTTFMLALMTASSVEEAARLVGVSAATGHRWYKDEIFRERFREHQREIAGHSMLLLKTSMNEALAVLRGVMNDTAQPAGARVSAARTVLDAGFRAVEISDVLLRLEALEARTEGEAK